MDLNTIVPLQLMITILMTMILISDQSASNDLIDKSISKMFFNF